MVRDCAPENLEISDAQLHIVDRRFASSGMTSPLVARTVTARRANLPQLIFGPNHWHLRHIPCSQEGRFAIVTNVGSGMRWTL
jgi:hypothetical protein